MAPAAIARLAAVCRRAETAGHLAQTYRCADTSVIRFTVVAAIVRHLLDDPLLPDALHPPDYPAAGLRELYADYCTELAELRTITTESGGRR